MLSSLYAVVKSLLKIQKGLRHQVEKISRLEDGSVRRVILIALFLFKCRINTNNFTLNICIFYLSIYLSMFGYGCPIKVP